MNKKGLQKAYTVIKPLMDSILFEKSIPNLENVPGRFNSAGYYKYVAYWPKYLEVAYKQYNSLNLHTCSASSRMLDIATGVGFFPYFCSLYHNAYCTELPIPLYKRVHKLLGLKASYMRITKGKQLDIEGTYDVITAFHLRFDKGFELADYHTFFQRIIEHLTLGGKAYFSLIKEEGREELHKELGPEPMPNKIFIISNGDSIWYPSNQRKK